MNHHQTWRTRPVHAGFGRRFCAGAVNVTIDVAKPGAVINKNVYGQFAEHLGTGIYEGMWVGPVRKSPTPRAGATTWSAR
jgi:hypothetical protein